MTSTTLPTGWAPCFAVSEVSSPIFGGESVDVTAFVADRLPGYIVDADLVREAMSLIWAARRGLSEAELSDLLGEGVESLPPVSASPARRASAAASHDCVEALISLSGPLREEVQRRYVLTPDLQAAAHLRLADYFDSRKRRCSVRGTDELPWQLAEAADAQAAMHRRLGAFFDSHGGHLDGHGAEELSWLLAESSTWRRLYDLLAALPFLRGAWQANEDDVEALWSRVERGSDMHLVDAYRPVIEYPQRYRDHVFPVARLLSRTGHPSEALSLLLHLARRRHKTLWRRREIADPADLQRALGDQALVQKDSGNLDGATTLFKGQERVCRERGDWVGLARCIGEQALIRKAAGDLDGALGLLKKRDRISRRLFEKSLEHKANGDLDGALDLLKKDELASRMRGDPAGLLRALGEQAKILTDRGDNAGAEALRKEQEDIRVVLKPPEEPETRVPFEISDFLRSLRTRMRPSAPALARFERLTAWPMLVLSVSIIPLIVAQLRISPLSPWADSLRYADLIVWTLFAAEFCIRSYLAPAPRGAFVRRNWIDLLLVLIPPAMVINFAQAGIFRSIRAVRVIRVVRAGRAMVLLARGARTSRRALRKHPIAWVLLVAAFVTVGAGIIVRVIEANHGVGPNHIDSHFEAFWWAIYNLSTLGSSDFRATTSGGRGLEITLALLGLGLFGLLAGSLGAFFVEKDESAEIAETHHDYQEILGRLAVMEAELARQAPGKPGGASVDERQKHE